MPNPRQSRRHCPRGNVYYGTNVVVIFRLHPRFLKNILPRAGRGADKGKRNLHAFDFFVALNSCFSFCSAYILFPFRQPRQRIEGCIDEGIGYPSIGVEGLEIGVLVYGRKALILKMKWAEELKHFPEV